MGMRSPLLTIISLLFWLGQTTATHGQSLKPDKTLDRPTRLFSPALGRTVIDGGSQRGRNLFHSFETFDIPEGEFAFFRVPANIDRILTRVTGSQASRIEGTLTVLSDADFFLLNPNGIQLGSQSRVNVGGSFVTSTASAIEFGNLGQFSALEPTEPPPRLTIAPSALSFAPNSAASVHIEAARTSASRGGIQVSPFESILVVANEITLKRSRLAAPQGSVVLRSTTDTVVPLVAREQGWDVSTTQRSTASGSISLIQDSRISINANTNQSRFLETEGQIKLQGGKIQIADGSAVFSGFNSNIQIFADDLQLSEKSRIQTQTRTTKEAGSIQVAVSNRLYLSDQSQIRSITAAQGDAGTIQIDSPRLSLDSGSSISATTIAGGNGGAVQLTAENIRLTGSAIEQTTSGLEERPSGIFARTTAEGLGGNIRITAQQLDLQAGAQISASSFEGGAAGTIQVDADQIRVSGVGFVIDPLDSPNRFATDDFANNGFASGIFSRSENSIEPAGAILINADQLILNDGAIVSTSSSGNGQGRGGELTIKARDRILLSGQARPNAPEGVSKRPSGLFVGTSGSGASGNLRLSTPTLAIRDGARISAATAGQAPGGSATLEVGNLRVEGNESQISVSSAGIERAGQLEIAAQTIRLDEQGSLIATTQSGNGGDIVLQVADSVMLRRGGQISTTAGDAQNGGDGGNIEIQTPFLVTRSSENSDITANAFSGQGGRIRLTADAILGLAVRQTNTPLSDITASSEVGLPGIVQLNTPDTEPGEGLDELPTGIVDVSQQIERSCTIQAGAANQFVVTGRGGIPLHPAMPLRHSGLGEAWISTEHRAHIPELHSPDSQPHSSPATTSLSQVKGERGQSTAPQEAVDWVLQPNGSVRLLAAIAPSHPGPNRSSLSCSEH